MTAEDRLDLLQKEISNGRTEPLVNLGRHDGYLFTEVQHVTVIIGDIAHNPMGGYKVPALRTYPEVGDPTNLHAAARAGEYFAKQRQRDEKNLDKARQRGHGHLGPIVDFEWRCNDKMCPCQSEDLHGRKKRSLT